ncbi:MAG: EamA family transporter, partial [Gammaproteobacteria bacterium]|nr:EamA family transporter [Gammaproteobacteria bacterium]
MHQTSGHWKLGFILALSTALLWGLLPIALKKLLLQMDAFTVTWYRFFASAVCLLLFQRFIARVRPFPTLNPFKPGLL